MKENNHLVSQGNYISIYNFCQLETEANQSILEKDQNGDSYLNSSTNARIQSLRLKHSQ